MKREELKNILQNVYNQEKWIKTLQFLSGTKNLLTISLEPKAIEIKSTKAKDIVSEIVQLGSLKTTDGITLPIFDVTLVDGIKIEYNRVGVNDLLKNHILKDAIKGAIVTFHYNVIARNEAISKSEWRFSFISKFGSDYFAETESIETNPKKYTYIFGTSEEHRTALERLYNLEQSRFRLEDFFEAFNVEPVSNHFFKEYKNFYQDFVFHISNDKNSRAIFEKEGISKDELEKDIRNFVKRLLGRLVFLYFLQKKHWLGASNKNYDDGDTNFLFNLFNYDHDSKDNFYQKWLSKLFFNALNTPNRTNDGFELPDGKSVWIPFLNGGLFEEHQEPERHRAIQFPPTLFELLFKFFNSYNFTIYENSPEDHTVAVDPEMLGHIFENLLEDNKDKGAFYTPKEIVHYMTQESLIEYLKTHVSHSREAIESLIKNQSTAAFTREDLKIVEKLIDTVKICDPAIGSGAFPMGLLQEIFALKALIHYELGYSIWSPAKIKQDIIQNSIYGVDLEEGAVAIARLRFWLSLVVDEPTPKPLPNLDYKIMQGNSLLESFEGVDLSNVDLFDSPTDQHITLFEEPRENYGFSDDIKQLMNDYFNPKNYELKQQIHKKIDKKVTEFIDKCLEGYENSLLIELAGAKQTFKRKIELKQKTDAIEKEIDRIENQLNNKTDARNKLVEFELKQERPYFLWHLFFSDVFDNGGFDIVIGNPPYIKEYTNKNAFDEFRKTKYYQGKMDLWYGFSCMMIDNLKDNGIQSFIAQNNWITSAGASKLRFKILNETEIKSFVDFGNNKVFQSAGIQTMIYVVQKKKYETPYSLRYSVLIDDKIPHSKLNDFLNFDLENEFAQKYPFEITNDMISDKSFTFNTNDDELVLSQILNKSNFKLSEKEVANGIHPHYDFVNKKISETSFGEFKNGEGIFGLSDKELENLNLSNNEKELIKPYFTTENFKGYYTNPKNKLWLIYTDSSFKNPENIKPYPNIKNHLDRFKDIITSDNKPYGLHRAREERFFLGEKIIVQRKCPNRPIFTYTDFDSYVSATFYVIKAFSVNQKYLTALLNSRLIAFWLRNKGSMQGNNFQLDKAPLLNIPLFVPDDVTKFTILVDYLLYLNNPNNEQILSHIENNRVAHHIEEILNMMIYELYFEKHMKDNKIDVIEYVNPKSIENLSNDQQSEIIKQFYLDYQTPENYVRQAIMLLNIKSKDILVKINKSSY